MIKCKNGGCPKNKDICCKQCDEVKTCEGACNDDPATCGDAEFEEGTSLQAFKEGQVAVLKQIADVVTAKKQLEAQEKELKVKLKEAMELHGVKKFESDILNLTYVAATTATSIDSPKLKKKYPDIATECSKTSNKSAYVKVSIK